MADNPLIPGSHGKPLNPDGSWRGEWWRFLRELSNQPGVSTELASQLNALAARVQTLEDEDAPNLIGLLSVVVQGSFLSLRGDVANPGEKFFYGTDETGAKGWYERLLSTLADVDLTGLADGDSLVWDATSERFVPGSTISNPMTTEGDIIVAGPSGVPERLPSGSDGQVLTVVSGVPSWVSAGGYGGIQIVGGSVGGSVITPGQTVIGISSKNYSLTGNWYLWCSPAGSIEVDIRRTTFGSLPPGPGDSICGGSPPSVVSDVSNSGSFPPVTIDAQDAMSAVVLTVTDATSYVLMLESA